MTTALTNLYVRNIPMDWTAAELIKLGEKYGPIVSAKIMSQHRLRTHSHTAAGGHRRSFR